MHAPFQVIKFLNAERAKEVAAAQMHLDAIEQYDLAETAIAYRRRQAKLHERRAEYFQSALHHLTKTKK